MYIYNYLSAAECVGGHQMDREKENNKWTALAGFEPVTICFRDCFKMPREPREGVQVKNHCVGLRPAPPLAEARVAQLATASFRENGGFSQQQALSLAEGIIQFILNNPDDIPLMPSF